MTREEAISVLEESKRQNEIMRDNPNTFFKVSDIVTGEKNAQKRIDALNMAISALRQQEHFREVTKKVEPLWISVKGRLPGRYETVLIAISTVNGYGDPAKLVTIGGYDHSEKRWEQYTSTDRQLCQGETVTHWIPLPEPPEEGNHEM